MDMRHFQAQLDALAESAGIPKLVLVAVYFRGGPADGQRHHLPLRLGEDHVGEHIALPVTVERGKREAKLPWTKSVSRQPIYEIISVESGLAVAQFFGEHEW